MNNELGIMNWEVYASVHYSLLKIHYSLLSLSQGVANPPFTDDPFLVRGDGAAKAFDEGFETVGVADGIAPNGRFQHISMHNLSAPLTETKQ